MKIIFFRHEVISFDSVESKQQKALDSKFTGAVFNYYLSILYLNFLNQNNFSYQILNEPLITNEIVFYFTKNFYLIDEINDKVSHLKSGGFIKYLMSQNTKKHSVKNEVVIQSLGMRHLHGIFEILFYGLLITAVTFVAEILHSKSKRICRSTLN